MFDTEIIKDLIKSKRLTQQQFADMIGKTKQTINNYFTGRTKIDIDTLIVIAKVLKVPISYFFEAEKESSNVGNFTNSTVINSKNSNFRVNAGDEEVKTTAEDLKAKIKELRKNNLFYWDMVESLIDNQSELLVKIVEEAPELQPFIAKQKETKRFIAQINTLTKLTDHKVLFSDNFFDYFENPY
ncbi:MAG: helix-turn-helix domain-containing protein [Bacteroidales bacterium]|nr:helix-turn-helix domain-containing protein [Bacteroidales bacterium]